MKKTVLLIEDDEALRSMLKLLLTNNNFDVLEAPDYHAAVSLITDKEFHVVLSDWMIPGGSGLQVVKRLRKDEKLKEIPIIMLTAKAAEDDQIEGFDAGADDYITKPFSNKELLVRMKALLRRIYPEDKPKLQVNNLSVDLEAHRVFVDDEEIELGPTEYKLLCFLMQRVERVFSRDQLIDHIWGNDVYIDDRTIDVHIGRLRKQLESKDAHRIIQTVRGAGYRLSAQSKD